MVSNRRRHAPRYLATAPAWLQIPALDALVPQNIDRLAPRLSPRPTAWSSGTPNVELLECVHLRPLSPWPGGQARLDPGFDRWSAPMSRRHPSAPAPPAGAAGRRTETPRALYPERRRRDTRRNQSSIMPREAARRAARPTSSRSGLEGWPCSLYAANGLESAHGIAAFMRSAQCVPGTHKGDQPRPERQPSQAWKIHPPDSTGSSAFEKIPASCEFNRNSHWR